MEATEIQRILESTEFTFAKTMPEIPHWWTVKKNWEDEFLFSQIVKYIVDNGVKEYFGGMQFTYLYLGEYKYWTYYGTYESDLINRAKI